MMNEVFGAAIAVYSRAQAIADGALVDLTAWAGEGADGMLAGFTVPVAVTAAVWEEIHAIPRRLAGLADVRGRAHDLLWMARCAGVRARDADRCEFRVIMPVEGLVGRTRRYVLHVGPGDAGEPVVTIMLPGED